MSLRQRLLVAACVLLAAPVHAQGLKGDLATLADYVYAAPPRWTVTRYPDGIVLSSPPSATNEVCLFTLWPMQVASGDLLADANRMFGEVYKGYAPANLTVRGTPMPQSLVLGTSGQGWEYAIVRRGVAFNGSEGRLGFAFVAKLGTRLAVISGVSRDPMVSSCLGELAGNVWPRFFYSLGFKGWSAPEDSSAMRKRIAGVWTAATATAADRLVLTANGRYGDAAAERRTAQGYVGNGAYTLNGNTITFTPDSGASRREVGLIRAEKESRDGGRTWAEHLYVLRTSAINGADYEVGYRKQ